MSRNYRKYDEDFKQGAVRLVTESGKPIAQVARDLDINEGTLGNWCAKARKERDGGDTVLAESEREELGRLRKENTELRMQLGVPPACGGMSSSDRWLSGWTRRWAGSSGCLHRRSEGRVSDSVCHCVPSF